MLVERTSKITGGYSLEFYYFKISIIKSHESIHDFISILKKAIIGDIATDIIKFKNYFKLFGNS